MARQACLAALTRVPAPSSASPALCIAQRLGPVVAYQWMHEGKPPAVLFLEMTYPYRVFLRTHDADGSISSESGWHGSWSKSLCTKTRSVRLRNGRKKEQTAGDCNIFLSGFRYSGMDAEDFTHDELLLERKADSLESKCLECGCGTVHPVTIRPCEGVISVPADVTPGMRTIHGFALP